jgi:pyruvate formate lyase activating enzyme
MGIVFDIQRFSVYDGPGIRTSVFLKGCMMRCPWCHNPESLRPEPQLAFTADQCLMCGRCAAVCPEGVHTFGEGHKVDFPRCKACGRCVAACPAGCLKIFGREMSAEQVMAYVLKDEKYYRGSGGGITVTGGEPTFQYDFLMELLRSARRSGLNTCIETNGIIDRERLLRLLPLVDLFLLDYKATGGGYPRFTLFDEKRVVDTLDILEANLARVVLRCPIIPGYNDTEEHFAAVRALRKKYRCIQAAEIMAYHSSALRKWRSLGMAYALEGLGSASKEQKELWEKKIAV